MSESHPRNEDFSVAAVIEAVADADSRSILSATATEPKTVADLIEECEIPIATAYRKVNRLTDVGLLVERLRIRPNGRNVATYHLCDEEVSVTVEQSIEIKINCSPAVISPTSNP